MVRKLVLKLIIAGSIAFGICSLFSIIYYNIPLKEINSEGGTDYKYQAHKFYSRGTEGYALGRTNNEGFNNIDDYNGQDIDILLMGSSHMEGFNVSQNKTTVARLNQILGEERFAYNIGVSAHSIYTQIANLKDALKEYKPREYVVLETMDLPTNPSELNRVINNGVEGVGNYTHGIIRALERLDYLKLLSAQYKSYLCSKERDEKEQIGEVQKNSYKEPLDEVLSYIKEISNEYHIVSIILFHPHLVIQKDGTVTPNVDSEKLNTIKQICQQKDIILIDMTDKFIEGYNIEKKLPYGFSNTKVGEGHLNEYGHSMIAEELSSVIMESEEEK